MRNDVTIRLGNIGQTIPAIGQAYSWFVGSPTISGGTTGGSFEPSGMTTVMNGEAMTGTPSVINDGTWFPGTTDGLGNPIQFQNLGPTVAVPFGGNQNSGQWAGNLVLGPGGTGMQLNYPPALGGGYSPTRFGGPPFRVTGTQGVLYVRFYVTFCSTWTTNGNNGVKFFDIFCPPAANVNHIIDTHTDLSNTDAYLYLALQGPGVPGGNIPNAYSTLEPQAQLGGSLRAIQHKVEIVVTQDTPAGAGNGTYQSWVDGIAAFGPQGGLNIIPAASGHGWTGIFWDPTYGGGGNSPPNITPNLFWVMDKVYASVK